MATSKNAKLQFESGQSVTDYTAMTDSGDHTVHTVAAGLVYSGKSGFEPVVRPNGMVSGRKVVGVHASADTVTIVGFSAYSKGVLHQVTATTMSVSRAATDVAKICSVTMTDAGAIIEVEGVDSADTTLVETRGAAGGPPAIPADSVEIAQIRMITNAAGSITIDEIAQVVGDHTERYDYPAFDISNIGDGDMAAVAAQKNAHVALTDSIPMVHGAVPATADAYKQIYIRFYTPAFIDAQKALDFSPCENTHAVSSVQVYGGQSVGSSAATLGQGGFTALMNDNVTDALLQEQDQVTTIKYFPDKNKTAFILTQGYLGISRTFPVATQNQAECTVSSERLSASFAS